MNMIRRGTSFLISHVEVQFSNLIVRKHKDFITIKSMFESRKKYK